MDSEDEKFISHKVIVISNDLQMIKSQINDLRIITNEIKKLIMSNIKLKEEEQIKFQNHNTWFGNIF